MLLHRVLLASIAILVVVCSPCWAQQTKDKSSHRREYQILDADSGKPIAARIYVVNGEGNHYFAETASTVGSAFPYTEEWVNMPESIEHHTTVSPHPFFIVAPAGEYKIEIERGKEYIPLQETISISNEVNEQQEIHTFRLRRWSEVAKRGWYSGETHVHRRIAELPNVMQAEELNVTFPVTYWTIRSDRTPDREPSPLRAQGPSPFGPREERGYAPIEVSPQYVIFPRNTEYEIFGIGDRQHVLGAVFILNHQTPFQQTAPPIRPIAQLAKQQGALLDLDKHNWPWSLMLIPIAKIDLFELSNNSVWRTNFGFKQAGMPLPPWAEIEQESPGVLTEWGWIQFGFEMYYALLNCGFHLSPTAGTASGVHPVPLGYSRVYVHTGDNFNATAWLDGLKAGRSFVTTGPMLSAEVEGKLAGAPFERSTANNTPFHWKCEVESLTPITRIEWVVNGIVQHRIDPPQVETNSGAFRFEGEGTIEVPKSGWAIVRTWTKMRDGRKQFAHSAPWYFTVDQKPVHPPKVQLDYLIGQIEAVTERQQGILSPEAIAEFIEAREYYRGLRSAEDEK